MNKIKNLFFGTLLISILLFSSNGENECCTGQFIGQGVYEGEYWPTNGWKSCKPEDVGMDSKKLMAVCDYVANPNIFTEGFVVIKKGYIVTETYFGNFTMDSRHQSYSIAKSFVSALIGIALEKELFKSVDEEIYHYYPELNRKKVFPIRSTGETKQACDSIPSIQSPPEPGAKRRITIKHLLAMSSGLKWNEQDYYVDTSQNDAFIMAQTSDYIQYVLNKPIEFEPGTVWRYSSGDSVLLAGLIERASFMSAYKFGLEHVFIPIGISGIRWQSDPAGHTIGGWGIEATVREYAKFGYLYLKKGKWEDCQIVPEPWIRESLQPLSERVNFYGYQWWLLPVFTGYEESIIPRDTFLAWGIYTQQIFVIPEEDIIIVRVANDPGSEEWDELEFLTLIINSVL